MTDIQTFNCRTLYFVLTPRDLLLLLLLLSFGRQNNCSRFTLEEDKRDKMFNVLISAFSLVLKLAYVRAFWRVPTY